MKSFDRVININVPCVFVATHAALKHMKSGGLIMIASCVGERAMTPGLVPYSATKGAVKMFTQVWSREVGSRGITVNNHQPGPIDTDLNPAAGEWAVPQKAATALNRYGQVDEVAALVAFVAGLESSYITGRILPWMAEQMPDRPSVRGRARLRWRVDCHRIVYTAGQLLAQAQGKERPHGAPDFLSHDTD